MVYLNNAASAWPRAPGVCEAVLTSLQDIPMHPGRTGDESPDVMGDCRSRLATLLGGVPASRIVLTQHATHALNLAILGLNLAPGDEVVTSVTEHNSMLRPLARLEDTQQVRLTLIGLTADGLLDEEAYERALQRSPRLVALNHISNVTGCVQRIGELFARAHRAGAITLLDASQSLGHISVDAALLEADLIAFTGHKGAQLLSGERHHESTRADRHCGTNLCRDRHGQDAHNMRGRRIRRS